MCWKCISGDVSYVRYVGSVLVEMSLVRCVESVLVEMSLMSDVLEVY
jgi:hypothetical protein